jgi:hypothetical protein
MRAPALPMRACACGGPPVEVKRRKGPGRPRKPRPACDVCGGTGVLPWHPETTATWALWWASPGASEWIDAHLPGLRRLIQQVEDYHRSESAKERNDLQKEIRLQEARFGIMSPLDMRRLEWGIDRPDETEDERPAERPEPPRQTGTDARAALRMVKS